MNTPEAKCPRCRAIRTILLSALLGGVAGFAVLKLGGSQNDSMLATFFSAIAPLLWLARKNRFRREDSE
jgi:hypothetical protein